MLYFLSIKSRGCPMNHRRCHKWSRLRDMHKPTHTTRLMTYVPSCARIHQAHANLLAVYFPSHPWHRFCNAALQAALHRCIGQLGGMSCVATWYGCPLISRAHHKPKTEVTDRDKSPSGTSSQPNGVKQTS